MPRRRERLFRGRRCGRSAERRLGGRAIEGHGQRHLSRWRLFEKRQLGRDRQLELGHEALEPGHRRLEFGRLGQQRRFGGEQALERHLRVEERREALGLELQRAQQPVAQRHRQRRVNHGRRLLAGARDEILEPFGELVVTQSPPDDEGEHREPHLHHIAALRDGAIGTGRHGHAQRVPQALAGPAQRVDGRAEHVVGEHQAGLRREEQVLRPERAAGRVAALRREQRRRGQQLPQQQHHDADVEGQILGFGHVEHVGKPPAAHVVFLTCGERAPIAAYSSH